MHPPLTPVLWQDFISKMTYQEVEVVDGLRRLKPEEVELVYRLVSDFANAFEDRNLSRSGTFPCTGACRQD